jgi:hypothetical protein
MEKIYHAEPLNIKKNIMVSSYKNKSGKYTVCLYLFNEGRYKSTVVENRGKALRELRKLRQLYGKQ